MNAMRHPIKRLEREARTLLEIERAGERPESLFIATASVMALVLPIIALVMVLAFGAAWIFG